MTYKHWLFVVGILVGALGVVVAGSAIGGVAGDDISQNQTASDGDGDYPGDRHAHADGAHDQHAHADGAHDVNGNEHAHADGTHDHSGEWDDRHQHAHAGDGPHHHEGWNGDRHQHAHSEDDYGPRHTVDETPARGGPCHP